MRATAPRFALQILLSTAKLYLRIFRVRVRGGIHLVDPTPAQPSSGLQSLRGLCRVAKAHLDQGFGANGSKYPEWSWSRHDRYAGYP